MKTLIKLLISIYILCFINSVNAESINSDKRTSLVFGVVPQQSAATLARNWVPLLKFLSENTGVELKFATAPDIPTFEERLAKGEYDIAYMNPYHYVVLSEQVGFKAIVHEKNKQIKGIIVANKNTFFDDIDSLSTQKLAFPAPASFAATLIPKANLMQRNINFESQYVNSHDAVYRNIAEGRFIAGGGIIRTFNALPKDVRDQLKIIWTSEAYTPHAIATYPSVSEEVRQKLLQGFLNVESSNIASELLSPLKMQGFIAAEDQDWNDVRELGIHLLLGLN